MSKSTASERMWAGRRAALVVALLTMVVTGLLAATPAWASSVSDVGVWFDPTEANHAGERAVYGLEFTTTNNLCCSPTVPSGSITISAPAGTVFHPVDFTLNYDVGGPDGPYRIPNTDVVVSDGGSTATILLSAEQFPPYTIIGGQLIMDLNYVTNPPEPGQYTLSVSTSTDTTPATSAPYTILPALVGGPPPGPEVPTAKEQCKKGGYEAFDFRNQGQCVAFVQRGPKN